MSGGFFRGTSSDQDSRFSDKQAKLLKSQKFAAELDHLVDTTKVKMDVMRPWIATKTTELLGFEDEVLINFINGLLEQKVVDGKNIQIQLTGFMEKNTVKFMKELWSLLLSAQQNSSGVPQQFLDAKEEEMRQQKAEADRITQEIQNRKDRERMEREREKKNKMDVEPDIAKPANLVIEPASPRTSSRRLTENEKDGRRCRTMRKHAGSPESNDHSTSPLRVKHKSRSRSRSISFSPIRQHKSSKRQSISPDVRHRPSRGRSISPRRRSLHPKTWSPTRCRSPYARRRSISRSRHYSPSPIRRRSPYSRQRSPLASYHRSPMQDKSFSPPRRRSQTPSRRRSPQHMSRSLARRRSRSPLRRRSPQRRSPIRRHRSPSPSRRRSPQHRSPIPRHKSPTPSRRRSPQGRSPLASRRSPAPSRRRSPQRRSPLTRRRSPSPSSMRSPHHRSGVAPRSSSPGRRRSTTPTRRRSSQRRSPIVRSLSRSPTPKRSVSPASGRSSSPSRSSRSRSPKKRMSTVPSPRNDKTGLQILICQRNRSHSPSRSQSPPHQIGRGSNSDHNHHSNGAAQFSGEFVSERADKKKIAFVLKKDSIDGNEHSVSRHKASDSVVQHISKYSPQRDLSGHAETRKSPSIDSEPMEPAGKIVLKKTRFHSLSESSVKQEREKRSNHRSTETSKDEDQISDYREDVHDETYYRKKASKHGPATRMKDLGQSDVHHSERKGGPVSLPSEEREYGPGRTPRERQSPDHVNSDKMINANDQLDTIDSGPEDFNAGHRKLEKQRNKKSYGRKREWDDDNDSGKDERKEAKRKKKDEKRQRKEEKRKRREERHQRKLERRSSKLRLKSAHAATSPSGYEGNQDGHTKRDSNSSDVERNESEQKRLEIELRNKALESLRTKKAISH